MNSGFAKPGASSKVAQSLERESIPFVLFDRVEPEPRPVSFEDAIQTYPRFF